MLAFRIGVARANLNYHRVHSHATVPIANIPSELESLWTFNARQSYKPTLYLAQPTSVSNTYVPRK